MGGRLVLYLSWRGLCPVHAMECNEQEITSRYDDPTAMSVDHRVNQSMRRVLTLGSRVPNVIQPNQAAQIDHIVMESVNKLPPIRQFSMRARWLGRRHAAGPLSPLCHQRSSCGISKK